MAYELKPGQGTLFQNDQKGNDRAPTHRGELCLTDGTVIKIAGWRKEGRKGPYLSLSIDKPREGQEGSDFRGGDPGGVSRHDRPLDDEIPF